MAVTNKVVILGS